MFLGATAFLLWQQSRPVPKVTSENLQRVKDGMTLQEVEHILGPGRPGPGPLSPDLVVSSAPKGAIWKHWKNPKVTEDGKESFYIYAFVDGRLVKAWVTSRPVEPELAGFVRPMFFIDGHLGKLVLPDALSKCHMWEYRGGYLECWIEIL